ncbi:MAG: DUF1553 domain-containing protein, partial [Verrucomicrobiota bacterium]
MGLTMGCARCHNHKYDPLSQKEYYQLIDYFNDVAESGRAVKFGNSEPWIKTPTARQRKELKRFDARVEKARQVLREAEPENAAARTEWADNLAIDPKAPTNGLTYHFDFDTKDDRIKIIHGRPEFREGPWGKAATVGGAGCFQLGRAEGLVGNGRFTVGFRMKPENVTTGAVLSNEANGTERQGMLVQFIDGQLRWDIITRWISGVSTLETERRFKPNEWVHVTLTNDGTQRAGGMKIYIDGQPEPVRVIRNTNSNKAGKKHGGVLRIGYSRHVGFWQGQLDDLRIYSFRTLDQPEVDLLAEVATVREIAAMPVAERSERQRRLLELAFLQQGRNRALLLDLYRAELERTRFRDNLPTTMIMRDLPGGRPSFIRERGLYDQIGERVEPGVPAVFPGLSTGQPNNRLTFARWLVSPDHPLTARVTVNRTWQRLFGQGLVRTPEDFGSQGEAPSHPELLDWLAATFVESGWDVKHLLKTIVTSRTYRQHSGVSPKHLVLDPTNVWLARMPRLPLPGNMLRDQALAVSGLL